MEEKICSKIAIALGYAYHEKTNTFIKANPILEENITAPISAGQKLGEISFSIDNNSISTVNLVAKNSVDKITLFTMAKKIYYSWIDLLRS